MALSQTRSASHLLVLALSLAFAAAPALAGPGAVELDVIVKEGDPTPGVTDGVFDLTSGFSNSTATAIALDGTVYFFAEGHPAGQAFGGQQGVWFGTGAFIDDVAVDFNMLGQFQPDPADCVGIPDCGILFNTQESFFLTQDGQVQVRTSREDANGTIAFLTGTAAPDMSPILQSPQIPQFPFRSLLALRTEGGQFLAGPYVGNKPFGEADGGLTDFVMPFIGGPAPFITDPVTITDIFGTVLNSGVSFGFNQRADRLFVAELSDGSEALYYDPFAAGPSTLLARTGEPTPGIGIGAYLALTDTFTVGRAGNAQINDPGQGYFAADWRNPSAPVNNSNLPRLGIWRFDNGGPPTLVVSEYFNIFTDIGFATSEFANTAFDNIRRIDIDVNGNVLFHATGRQIGGGGVPDTSDERVGVWRAAPGGQPQLILRVTTSDSPGSSLPNGPDVPGTPLPGGGNFRGFGLDGYAIDEHGHLLFDTADAIYAEDDAGIRLVIADGQTVELGPTDLRTVAQARIETRPLVSSTTQAYRADRLALRVLFEDGSRAILRTRFLPPPPPPRLVGLEAVQVVQDWNNSVPLYAKKPTLVRAHFRADQYEHKNIVLRVFDAAGDEMGFSPLAADVPGGQVPVGPENILQRKFLTAAGIYQLPPEALAGQDITVRVENLDGSLDCQEAAGNVPGDCALQLSFTASGKPQIKIISLDYMDPMLGLQRVNRAARIDLVERLISAFPVSEVDWTDAESRYTDALDTSDMLLETQVLRILDDCNTDDGCLRIYYGALRAFNYEGEAADIPGFAATGFLEPDPKAVGRHTHTHEFGHTLGRPHSVTDNVVSGLKVGPCDALADPMRSAFPFLFNIPGKGLRQTLGPMDQGDDALVFGYDSLMQTTFGPDEFFDLMGYCSNPVIDLWPSTHTYGLIATHINGQYPPPPAGAKRQKGPGQDLWVLVGAVRGSGNFILRPLLRLDGAGMPDVSPAGTFQVNALNAASQIVASTSFEPQPTHGRGAVQSQNLFVAALPVQADATRIEIRDGAGALAAELVASANPPTVQVTSPNGGEVLSNEEVMLAWTADDADGDALSHNVQFSADGGATWTTLAANHMGTSYPVRTESLTATSQGLFRVQTSDGLHFASDNSDAVFTVPDAGPTVVITAPGDQRTFYNAERLTLRAVAFDTEDGTLGDAAIAWSSDLDGPLGAGRSLPLAAAALTVGTHLITATATDLAAETGQDQVTVIIGAEPPAALADLALAVTLAQPPNPLDPPPAAEIHTLTAAAQNLGPNDVADGAFSLTLSLPVFAAPPTANASIDAVRAPAGWTCQTSALTISCSGIGLAAYDAATLELDVLLDASAVVQADASLTSSVADPDGANHFSSTQYLVGQADLIFGDGFE